MTIIVNPVIGVTVNSATICADTQATVTATPAIPGIYNYAWTVPAGVANPGNVASFTTTTAGTYTVVLSQTNSFCNSGFDSEVGIPPLGMSYIHESNFPCWDTTATDGMIEVWATGRQGIFSYSGIQFVELNANQVSTLYQDLTVVPGTSASISFAHRGRTTGTDVMQVEIGPVGGPYISLGQFSATPTAWVYNTIPYVFPMNGGTNYTIRFVSVSSGSGFLTYGNFIDAVSVTGLSCPSLPASGTVTVTPLPTVMLTSTVGTDAQTVCQNVAINNITYNVADATGATVSGLPTGVTGSYATGIFSISGTPTATGVFNYTVMTTGGCTPGATISGTIMVTSPPVIVLTSTVGTDNQVVCQNVAINNITYNITDAVGATVVGLPTGVTGTYATGVFSINGTPTVSGIFNYTVTTIGGCSPDATTTGTITVLPVSAIALTSTVAMTTQTVCENVSIVNITYNIANATGATVSGLPVGVTGSYVSGVFTISGTPTVVGTFNYTVTTVGGCTPDAIATGIILVNPIIIPTFTQIAPICLGTVISELPTTSNNGITGVWSPILNNTATTTYTFTPNTGECAISTSMTITITPKPVLTYTVTNPICDGSTLDFVLNSNVPGTTYTWSASNNDLTGFIASGDQTDINQLVQLINPMSTSGSISMVILPSFNGCVGDPTSLTILVKPNPKVNSITQEDDALCSGEMLHMDVTGEPSGLTYNWTAVNINGVLITSGVYSGTTTGAIDLQLATTNPTAVGTIQFEITPVRNGCYGAPVLSDVITVNPIPGSPIGLPHPAICSGEPTSINVSENLHIAGTLLEWEVIASSNVTGFSPTGSALAPISINDILFNSSNVQGFVTYRVTSVLGECEGSYTDITVLVNPLPKPVLTDGHICVNATTGVTYQGYILDTQLSDPNFTYDWFLFNTTTNTYDPIAGASSSTYEAMEPGNYQVIVTNSITNCTGEASADVIEVFPATAFTATVSDAFTDNSTITVIVNPIGTGNLIYSLDGGSWQQSNVFTGVEAGIHTVVVSDLEGCTDLTLDVTVIDYPKYFTPNGDGIHDTWNITGLNQADAKLYIFDRYGKLIKQISTLNQSQGWDGTYNGAQMPSTDYWFTLDYTENNQQKQFKAHFSLKR